VWDKLGIHDVIPVLGSFLIGRSGWNGVNSRRGGLEASR
jgi:hypothetical protein